MKTLIKFLVPLLLLISVSSFGAVPVKPKLITNGDMSLTLTSIPFPLWQVVGYSPGCAIQAVFTGTPNGTLTLQASLDGINYSTVGGSTQAIAAAGSFLYNISGVYYPFLELKFVPGGGSVGVLNVLSYGKGQ